MPPVQQLTWQEGDLFAPMDQNLPEGDLFMRIRAMYPKQPMTPMQKVRVCIGIEDVW
jgi:serine/threonine-protein kinase HipA